KRLFEICRNLRDQGVAIVYVSHRLSEILEICDRVTVLRDGQLVDTVGLEGVSEQELARMMVGAERSPAALAGHELTPAAERGEAALRVRNLEQAPRLKPCDFEIAAGEILAVFGLVGAGRTRLARTLFGLEPAT